MLIKLKKMMSKAVTRVDPIIVSVKTDPKDLRKLVVFRVFQAFTDSLGILHIHTLRRCCSCNARPS